MTDFGLYPGIRGSVATGFPRLASFGALLKSLSASVRAPAGQGTRGSYWLIEETMLCFYLTGIVIPESIGRQAK